MRVVVAPDSFKESLTAPEACLAMKRGILDVFPQADVVMVPMADGGEGTVDALVEGQGGQILTARVRGPLGEPRDARLGLVGDLGIIEVAEAVGIGLVPPGKRDVWKATSLGVADLVDHAVSHGARRLLIGLGGTGTNDAGAGFLAGLGARLFDADHVELAPTPRNLSRVATVDLSRLALPAGIRIDLACDVTNPLLGRNGASAVFGPQKGLASEDVETADRAHEVFISALEAAVGRRVRDTPGAGAAGGLGAALVAVGAIVRSGVETVAEAANLAEAVEGSDLVLTGEGRIDAQTLRGKAPAGVAAVAAAQGVDVIAFAGSVSPEAETLIDSGFSAIVPITSEAGSLEKALASGSRNLEAAVRTSMRLFRLGGQLRGQSPD